MVGGKNNGGKIIIEFADLELHDKCGSVYSTLDSLNNHIDDKFYASDGHCRNIYNRVNEQLKIAVDKLVIAVENAEKKDIIKYVRLGCWRKIKKEKKERGEI
jgi:hypothetical protein